MRLKTLELQGFKSFPDRTVLSFDSPFTAVVGPNGSGKSNLSDSIRWVLGEQSAKSLRGGRMEDVIFSGAQGRGRQGFAQVSLTLEHCGDLRPDLGEEITVTRRYYRSGESEYELNGKGVRLRDVNELFMDTGLGQDGYALIGQGKIDDILSVKSTQRREIFEEAAGISRCRHQKEETQRKLERTRENLLRITDKLEELEFQRGPLQEQAARAERFLALREELRILEVSLWMAQLDESREKNRKLRSDWETAKRDLDACARRAEELYAQYEDVQNRQLEKTAGEERLRQTLSEIETDLRNGQQRVALLRAQRESNETAARRIREELGEKEQRQTEAGESLTRQRERLRQLMEQEETVEEALAGARMTEAEARAARRERQQKREEAVRQSRTALARCREREKQAEQSWMARRMEENALANRVKLFREMEAVYEGYSRGVKTAMTQAGRGGLSGVLGPVGELFHVPARYTVALETALGGAMQNLIVEDEEAGKGVLQYLKRSDGGRVTCLPLTALRPAVLREEGIENEPGFLAIAADVVDCDEKCQKAAASLLGRTVVVDTLSNGVRLAKKRSYRFPVVTLDGEILRPGGSMTGGSVNRKGGILSRAAESEETARKLESASAATGESEKALGEARRETARALEELEARQRQLNQPEEESDREESAALETRLAAVQAERRAFEELLSHLTRQQSTAQADYARQEGLLSGYQRENESLAAQVSAGETELAALETRRREAAEEVRHCAEERLALEAQRVKADRESRAQNDLQLKLQRESAGLEQRKLQADMEEARLTDKLWETYGMTRQGAQSVREDVGSIPRASRRAGQLHESIRALGDVNVGAVEEFRRLEERYTYLNDQKTDIETAGKELEGVIEAITDEMEGIFLREFARIQRAFAGTFSDLFGGGTAALELEDEKAPLTCGIDIQAQPPGKTGRAISLLSGGERTLVAIALYFAILKTHPTPFCVVDEVEAALDEANAGRFVRYLKTVSRDTQFIVITHRRETMESADLLYGVTMERQGVSKVLRLALAEVEQLLE